MLRHMPRPYVGFDPPSGVRELTPGLAQPLRVTTPLVPRAVAPQTSVDGNDPEGLVDQGDPSVRERRGAGGPADIRGDVACLQAPGLVDVQRHQAGTVTVPAGHAG